MTTNEAHMEISEETIKVAVDAFLAVPRLRNGDRHISAMRAALLAAAPALTKAAVEAEREDCAKIAYRLAKSEREHGSWSSPLACELVGDAIRARKEPAP